MKKVILLDEHLEKIDKLETLQKGIIFENIINFALRDDIEVLTDKDLKKLSINLISYLTDLKDKQEEVSIVKRKARLSRKTTATSVQETQQESIEPIQIESIQAEPPEPIQTEQFSIVEKSKPMGELNLRNIHFPENKFDYTGEVSDVELRYKNKVSYGDDDSFLGTIGILIQNEFERLKQYNGLKSDLIKSYTTDTLGNDKSRYKDETLVSYLKGDDVHCLDKTINFLEISIGELIFYAKEYIDVLTDEVKNRTSILKYSLDKVIMYKNRGYYDFMNGYDNPVRLRSYYDGIKPYFVDVLNSTQVLSTACTINNPNFKTGAEDLLPYFMDYQPVSTGVLRDGGNQDGVMEYYFDIAGLLFTEQLKHEEGEHSPLMLGEITFIDFLKNYYQQFFKINLYDNEYGYA